VHYNTRFVEVGHSADKLATLNDHVLAIGWQSETQSLLSLAESRKAHPDAEQFSVIGSPTAASSMPGESAARARQARRLGDELHDVTERERMSRVISALESELPREVAEARASSY
jgi:hypothetical protein